MTQDDSRYDELPDFLSAILDTDDDDDALTTLQEGDFRAPVIAPPDERFPPLQPQAQRPEPDPAPAPPAPKKRGRWLYNLITVLSLLGALALMGMYVVLWQNPLSVYNPFPPSTPFVQITATPGDAIASAGAEAPMPTPNAAGEIVIIATETPAGATAPQPDSPFPFVVADSVVIYAPNENDLGCEWASIAGSVVDTQGNPLDGYRVRVSDASDFNETVFTGSALTFGAGGYEMPLVGVAQDAEYTVQLLNPQGTPLSDEIRVATRAACDSNVAILNFVQVRPV